MWIDDCVHLHDGSTAAAITAAGNVLITYVRVAASGSNIYACGGVRLTGAHGRAGGTLV